MAMRSHQCGQVTEALIGQQVKLAGWVNRRRDHGGVIFIDLRDRDGFVQVVCDPDRPEMFKIAEQVRNEFCVQIHGLVRARPAGTENTELTTGKIEILCHELVILNASVTTSRDRVAMSRFTFEMADPSHLNEILKAVRNIDGVYDVYRV